MPSKPIPAVRLEAHIAPNVLGEVCHADALQCRGLSDFVVAATHDVAEPTIDQVQVICLSVEDQQAFAEAILNPPPLAPAMERAIARHHEVIATSR